MDYLRKKDYKKMDLMLLIDEAQGSDWVALEELLRRHSGIIYSTLYHLGPSGQNIDDLSQEVLMRIAKSIKSLKKKEHFKLWMNQIIYNVFYDDLRRKKRKPNMFSIDSFYDEPSEFQSKEIEDTSIHPDEKIKNFELDVLIRKSIRELEEPFREVVVLRELQGLSYEQIARILDTNIGTVKSRIARARAKLQEKLKDYLD
ncbi:MAG: sigma-70 family RNA polymerase sigma factor [Candidatus Gastranaerophilales bacterium]|nr:sigma-70 family RNA polymerase sigma factor [Candidatus Gastranaerophilales bacterium]